MIVSPAVTPLTERLGFYRILIVTSLITAVFGIAASLLLDSGRLSVIAALGLIGAIGVTTSFHVPAVYTTLSWFVGEHRIPAAISTINLRTGFTWVVGPVIGATLVAHDNADALGWLVAAGALINVATVVAKRKIFAQGQAHLRERSLTDPGCTRRAIDEGIEDADGNGVCMLTQAPTPGASGFLKLLRQPVIAFMMVMYLILYSSLGSFSVLVTPWLTTQLAAGAMVAGVALSVRSAASIPGTVVAEWLTRRVGIGRTILATGLLTAVGTLLAARQDSWGIGAIIGIVIYGALFFALTSGVMTTLVTVTIGKEQRAEGQALYAFVKGIVSAIFLAIGVVATLMGVSVVMIVTTLLALAALIFLRFALRDRWDAVMTQYQARLSQAKSG